MKEIINMSDNNGNSVLHISAFNGDFRIVKKLVFYGGDKTKENDQGQLPVDLSKDNFVRKVLSQGNNKTINQKEIINIENDNNNENKYKNRSSLFITEKFISMFYKRDSLKLKHKRASIFEKYDAIKNENEEEEKKMKMNTQINLN